MEQLRDTYASDSLATLAKSLGFDGEPAHINHAIGKEEYTLAIIQKWLDDQDILVYCIPSLNELDWVCKIRVRYAKATETEFGSSYNDVLEQGLRMGCMLLKEKQDAGKVLD